MNQGCVCPSGTSYASVDNIVCTDEMIELGCSVIPFSPKESYKIINGQTYCAKRESSYNYLTMQKPKNLTDSNNATIGYTCLDFTFTKMCGTNNDTYDMVNCIPPNAECPFTKFSFNIDDSTKMITSRDASFGMPLVDIKLSEGGPPCLHDSKDLNQ